MNLVDMIKDQVTSEITGKLASMIGGGEAEAKSALGAAIPGLLSAFSGMAATESGASKLASAFNSVDSGTLDNITSLITKEPEQAASKGGDLLGSLLGGGAMTALVGTLVKFLASNPAVMKKVLGFAAPFVMNAIFKQFQGKPATAAGLTSLFNSQKSNIASAIPSGLSLADVPGWGQAGNVAREMGATARNVGRDVERTARAAQDSGSSLMKSLIPIAALALLGFLAWRFFSRPAADQAEVVQANREVLEAPVTDYEVQRPVQEAQVPVDNTAALPDLTKFSTDLGGMFTSITDSLNGITDEATAVAALPKLGEYSTQIDNLAAIRDQLPQAGRAAVTQMANEQLGPLQALIKKVLAIPGVQQTLEPVLNQIVTKLTGFGG